MQANIEGSSLTLVTRASPLILAVLPQLEGRRTWLKGGGLRVENTPHNVERLRAAFPALDLQGETAGAEEFDGLAGHNHFSFKRIPDPHQQTALDRCEKKRNFGHFMEQGTGKTKVSIDHCCRLFAAGQITGVLVVTKKGVHRQWIEAELPKDHSAPYLGDYWRKKPSHSEVMVKGGALKWWTVNYDALRGQNAWDPTLKFAKAHQGSLMIIADESQCIMNHTSGRHKAMMTLRPYSSHRLLLTGTPMGKDLTDQWAQLKWLDESILGAKYLTTFRAQYCIMGGYEGRAVVGHKNLDEFKRRCAPYTYRVTKAEIGYIPKRYGEWVYDLLPDQIRLIKQIKQELMAELKDGDTVPISSATAAFSKVQQITNGFIISEEQKAIRLMPVPRNPRAQAAIDWLNSYDGKAVIWTRFTEDRAIMAEALQSAGISFAEYTGSDGERHKAKARFIADVKVRCFLANPQSAGTGLDGLQTVCTQALYYSNSFNAIDRWQSEDRIDRRGMIGGSNYTDLIGKGSTDRYILRNLKKKKGLSALSLGDIHDAFDEF